MTTGDYIKQKFQTFGIQLSEADLFEIILSSGEVDEVDKDTIDTVAVAIARFIHNDIY